MSTTENLKAAFAGESQANRKYLAFAKKADADGMPQIAKLFRAAAEAETIHAHSHLRVLKGVGSTVENLKAAVAGEAHEFNEMYPAFLKEAQAEKNAAAIMSFGGAMACEKVHHDLYAGALDAATQGRDLAPAQIYVCAICGDTHIGTPPDRCPICNAPKEKYVEVK